MLRVPLDTERDVGAVVVVGAVCSMGCRCVLVGAQCPSSLANRFPRTGLTLCANLGLSFSPFALLDMEKVKWKRTRPAGLSASQFGAAVGLMGRVSDFVDYHRNIVGTDLEFTGNAATAHGIRTEDTARCVYEILTGSIVRDGSFFCKGSLGASPDGIVCGPSEAPTRILEIKSPFKRLYDGRKESYKPFGIPQQYMCQMQGQMALSGAKECDFFTYLHGPEIQVCAFRVMFSTTCWEWMEPILLTVSRWIENGLDEGIDRSFEFPPFNYSLIDVHPLILPMNLTTRQFLSNAEGCYDFFERYFSRHPSQVMKRGGFARPDEIAVYVDLDDPHGTLRLLFEARVKIGMAFIAVDAKCFHLEALENAVLRPSQSPNKSLSTATSSSPSSLTSQAWITAVGIVTELPGTIKDQTVAVCYYLIDGANCCSPPIRARVECKEFLDGVKLIDTEEDLAAAQREDAPAINIGDSVSIRPEVLELLPVASSTSVVDGCDGDTPEQTLAFKVLQRDEATSRVTVTGHGQSFTVPKFCVQVIRRCPMIALEPLDELLVQLGKPCDIATVNIRSRAECVSASVSFIRRQSELPDAARGDEISQLLFVQDRDASLLPTLLDAPPAQEFAPSVGQRPSMASPRPEIDVVSLLSDLSPQPLELGACSEEWATASPHGAADTTSSLCPIVPAGEEFRAFMAKYVGLCGSAGGNHKQSNDAVLCESGWELVVVGHYLSDDATVALCGLRPKFKAVKWCRASWDVLVRKAFYLSRRPTASSSVTPTGRPALPKAI